ncbi:MAG: spore gernimation protein [Clostridiales bacterium 43-6]|nr:MAG: spore gernimation protein [Clostridiales bacterium 43-6]
MMIHVVQPQESVYSIATKYGVPYERVIADNEITNPQALVVGQTLVIMDGMRKYTIRRGDTLYGIARRYGVTVDDLVEANPGINPQALTIGQAINIPSQTKKLGSIRVNGFAFPSINLEVLRKTLPSLTYLSIFSYDIRPDGSLNTINDEPLIREAKSGGVAPMMVISNIEEGSGFSSDLIRTVLNSEQIQNTLIDNVIAVLDAKGYYGLNLDLEYVYPEDREKYNSFIRKITSRLEPLGYLVTSSIAPKQTATQRGRLYEAHDYPVHGRLLNYVIIMTYEWGYTYGPAQAVAPLNQVRRTLDYAVTAIPRNKILLGVPNYGYDWTLPFVQGSAARSLTNKAAVELAARVGANIKFDEKAKSPFFNYYDSSGKRHEVWFEDARSMEATLRLVNEYGLAGISFWTINSFSPQNILVLNGLYDIIKVYD